jgi:hypothetical protein
MKEISILYPVIAHVILVLGLYILLGLRKSAAVKRKSVDLKKTSINNQAPRFVVVNVLK